MRLIVRRNSRDGALFGEIARALVTGGLGKPITLRVLGRELSELTCRDLIARKDYRVVPKKVEYSIAERGRALIPILSEIVRWGASGVHEQILGEVAASQALRRHPGRDVR